MMAGSSGLVPVHLRRTKGFPGTCLIVWDWSERDLACEVRKSEDCL